MLVSTAQSIADSPPFKLPPELRNRIYEYTFASLGNSIIIKQENGIPEPSLLASCKIIRREAIGIFYSPDVNDLEITIDSFHPARVTLWARKRILLKQQYGVKKRN